MGGDNGEAMDFLFETQAWWITIGDDMTEVPQSGTINN
jgi:hypothetical protein